MKIKQIATKMINLIMDFIFPPNIEEKIIREISFDKFVEIAKTAEKTPYHFIKSSYSYIDALIKEIVWQIKYMKNDKAIELGSLAIYKYIKDNLRSNKILLIPIPISKQRRKERGYNQCEILIDKVIEIYNKEYDPKITRQFYIQKDFKILRRKIHKDRQTLKSRKDRIVESEGIFEAIPKEGFEDYKILIIDDVVTTGSTARSAYKEMKMAKYKNVEVLSLAR